MPPVISTSRPIADPKKECPLSRRLFHVLAGSPHYHMGLDVDDGGLAAAMDRLAEHCIARLPRGRILDVGCALGGTAALLAKAQRDVTAIDPCAATIASAREAHAAHDVTWLATDLDRFAASDPAPFDGVVMIESLQGFPDLDALAQRLVQVMDHGAIAVIADTVTVPRLPFERVPFHRRGELARAARAAGLQVVATDDVTEDAAPTLHAMYERLQSSRERLYAELDESPESLDAAADELALQLQLLARGFADGDLRYEITVLQR